MGGIGRVSRARVILSLTVLALAASSLSLFALATHQTSQTLNAEPETQTVTVGSRAFITATINPPANTHSINVDFENENGGANDPGGDAADLTPPDMSCVIGADLPASPSASASPTASPTASPSPSPSPSPSDDTASSSRTQCTVSYVGATVNTDRWRVWIDKDGSDSTEEADDLETRGADDEAETPPTNPGNGQGCATVPSIAEPDCTDVVEVTWVNATAAKVDCDDPAGDTERETNPSGGAGSNETYTCKIQDAAGNPVNVTVRGEVENGINDPDDRDDDSYDSPDYACGAVSNGQCDITVTQNEDEVGTAEICFWVEQPGETGSESCDNEPTDETENNDLADQVEKTWSSGTASPSGTGSATPSGRPTGPPSRTPGPSRTSEPSSPQQSDRSLTLSTDRSRTKAGGTVVFAGAITSSDDGCEDSETVTITRRIHGRDTVTDFATVVSASDGSFSLSKKPRRSADYSAEVDESTACDGALSNVSTVQVKVRVDAVARPTRLRRGERARIVTKAVPAHPGTKVTLLRRKGTRLVKVDTARLNGKSKAVFTFRARWRGLRTFRVRWKSQDQDHEAGRSRPVRIRTRR